MARKKLVKVPLRVWRKAAGLTLEEAGQRLGLSSSQVSRLETGAVQSVSRDLAFRVNHMTAGAVTANELLMPPGLDGGLHGEENEGARAA